MGYLHAPNLVNFICADTSAWKKIFHCILISFICQEKNVHLLINIIIWSLGS